MDFYTFGIGESLQKYGTPELLGGKGAGLLWLSQQGVPVPPGFVIPTTVWAEYDKKPKGTMKEIAKAVSGYLKQLKAHFGYLPLLAVRSGARVSCPGMMDTILNVGIDDTTSEAWMSRLGSVCYTDSYHRLVIMYGSVVHGIRRGELEQNLPTALKVFTQQTGLAFPDAKTQLLGAIEAVLKSWDNPRAKDYRGINHIPREWGTAVTIQAMVFGNLNDQSGTGVLFTRHPDTGENVLTGEFLINAQGEDVVAGIRTPQSLDQMIAWNPTIYNELLTQATELEDRRKEMLDIEFTIQDGTLYILQVRTAKRSALAAIKVAVEMHQSGVIDTATAVKRVTAKQLDLAHLAHLDPTWTKAPNFTGIPATSGVVSGKPVFTKEEAVASTVPCILVTTETNPDDIAGIYAAAGVITMIGGVTSHAAVCAMGFNRACIVGLGESVEAFKEAEIISLDGSTGRIWLEAVPIIKGKVNGLLGEFSQLVFNHLKVVPVIFEVPTEPMPQAVLYLGGQILDIAVALQTVLYTLLKVDQLYVDLAPIPGSPEAGYLALYAAANLPQQLIAALEMEASSVGTKLLDHIKVIGDVETIFQKVTTVNTLESLVLAGKEIVVDGLEVSDKAVLKVLAWKGQEHGGVSVVSLGQYVPGVKSMLSLPQALHVIANGGG